jgi:urease accessory protein
MNDDMQTILRKFLTLTLVLTALPAAAHPGHGNGTIGLLAGFMHPLTGLDHLLAMFAIGLWSATTTRRAWLALLVFSGALLLGALLAANGLTLPALEPMLAASVLVLGLLLMSRVNLPEAAVAALVASFAWFHGAAHGAELGAGITLAGMMMSTMLLYGAGIAARCWLRMRNQWWQRGIGAGIALTGIGLALNLV